MIRVAIYGASGYGGVELLRLLLAHPDVEVCQATSREPGRRVDDVHPGLRGLTDLVLSESRPEALQADLDAVFFALPHGESSVVADAVGRRCPKAKLFDLAQDFRTGAEDRGWVYGLPEFFGEEIARGSRIACPGCFATAILLGTLPAVAQGLPMARIIVDAKTGSSGSGATAQAGTHHPTRVSTIKAYKVFEHQHEREIRAAWRRAGERGSIHGAPAAARRGSPAEPDLYFVPQSTPLVRGIYACCYLLAAEGAARVEAASIAASFTAWYARRASPFVRLRAEPPNVAHVRGTNNAEIFLAGRNDVALAIVALDNLVKGAAGQAVQCMNVAFGLDEARGLRLAALVP